MSDAVLGAVLVGGASRRMGQDKATLALDGMPMAHRVQHALFDGGVGAVVHVGGDLDDEGSVPDRWPGEGPLAGLAAAVAHGEATDGVTVVVVAACDQPDLSAAAVAALVQALGESPGSMGAAIRTDDGRRHPFPSAWRTSAATELVQLVEAGERRADASFTIGPVVDVSGDASSIEDLDTPDDVRRWHERHPGP